MADTDSEYAYVALLGLRAREPLKIRERIEAGFPYAAVERFQKHIELPTPQLADLIQVKPRTLSRRRDSGRLMPAESDRLLRAARILGEAIELFEGDDEAARAWLAKPQPALGGATPLAFARTEMGAREVEKLIGRLEHGVIS